jgi:hypothetical protein
VNWEKIRRPAGAIFGLAMAPVIGWTLWSEPHWRLIVTALIVGSILVWALGEGMGERIRGWKFALWRMLLLAVLIGWVAVYFYSM